MDLSRYVEHLRFRLNPGSYTDDTQIARSFSYSFVTAFKRDSREGCSRSFYHFLGEIQDGEEFLTKINPDIGVIF